MFSSGLIFDDTIVAPATSLGAGGLRSILRLTGPQTFALLPPILASELAVPKGPFVKTVSLRWEQADRTLSALLLGWPGKRTSTGDPTAELHFLAAPPLLADLQAMLVASGARLARPGEFTLRAFLAGKVDLLQAEGILGLVHADEQETLRAAIDQRTGGLSRPVIAVRDELLNLLADVEAGLDFVDEDISFISNQALAETTGTAADSLRQLRGDLDHRAKASELPRVVLVGLPNAGKSSLFNALVESEHALVSDQAGTTRDYLSAEVHLGDLAIELVDTAGIEAATDLIMAQAGTAREQVRRGAALIVHCRSLTETELEDPIPPAGCPVLEVHTKCDLAPDPPNNQSDTIGVSVHEPETLQILKSSISARLDQSGFVQQATPLSLRCRESLTQAIDSLEDLLAGLEADGEMELAAVHLREAISQLGSIVGTVYTEDLLDRIFSRFCIGK